ncbi:MAG: hypothetical protein QM765_45215 [Myxococcales bacterium]
MTRRSWQPRAWSVMPALLCAAVATGCPRSAVTRDDASAAAQPPPSHALAYADGSGNAWLLDGARLRYVPVRPEESSSGTYSGGEPFERSLTAEERAELTSALDAAWAAVGAQVPDVPDRGMGSGLVSRERAGGRESVVLAPGCREQRVIESVLASMRPAGKD